MQKQEVFFLSRKEFYKHAEIANRWPRTLHQRLPKTGMAAVEDKTKRTFTIRSSNCTLWYLPQNVENLYQHKIWMFTATLFTIAKTWK